MLCETGLPGTCPKVPICLALFSTLLKGFSCPKAEGSRFRRQHECEKKAMKNLEEVCSALKALVGRLVNQIALTLLHNKDALWHEGTDRRNKFVLLRGCG